MVPSVFAKSAFWRGLYARVAAVTLVRIRPDRAATRFEDRGPRRRWRYQQHRQHRAKDPVIQVTDETGAPLKDASVTFLLPDTGPSGAFGASGRTLTVLTDEKGQATGRGLVPNQVAGKFEIH